MSIVYDPQLKQWYPQVTINNKVWVSTSRYSNVEQARIAAEKVETFADTALSEYMKNSGFMERIE